MADSRLAEDLAEERSRAIRLLLATPLVDVGTSAEDFRLVVRHGGWLAEWFDTACGWGLVVDTAAGFARLAKRGASPDASRPLLRTRGTTQPFDRRRYQLLCLVCAELVRHPVTTIGLLAAAIGPEADVDTSRHGERAAFVDALRALVAWGALRVSAGDVDAFLDAEGGNAILTAETARLHRLLVSSTAPTTLAEGVDTEAATAALGLEPRYGDAAHDPAGTDDDQRLRWVRHRVARRLLDDPVVHLDELSDAELEYLANPSGRRWLRDRVAEAGFELEERAEGLLAIDPSALATDRMFPAPHGNAHQLALLLVDRLVSTPGEDAGDRSRRLGSLTPAALHRSVAEVLERFPGWARSHREAGGPERLADEAVGLLEGFGLVRRDSDGTIAARPALARYRVGAPTTAASGPTLFEEEP
jgi:uncharacterized protein (TIGR02678 family)